MEKILSAYIIRRMINVLVFVLIFAELSVGTMNADGAEGPVFAYSGDIGPWFWGELSDEWNDCAIDHRQSPINISHVQLDRMLRPLELDLRETPVHLINNGHTIEQEYEEGSTLILNGANYDLLQFHFHTFSEHTVRGERFPMELHAVFKDADSGQLAVVGMFFRIGEENQFLAQFDDILPVQSGDHESSEHKINLADGLTHTGAYYTYPGSLTTPPCSPIVTWIVLKKSAEISLEQFHEFRNIMGNNFRPLQDLNDRVIRATARGGLHHGK